MKKIIVLGLVVVAILAIPFVAKAERDNVGGVGTLAPMGFFR